MLDDNPCMGGGLSAKLKIRVVGGVHAYHVMPLSCQKHETGNL